jgi:hypothetical protein
MPTESNDAAERTLLACPFCGRSGEYNDVSICDEDWPGANGEWWLAGCKQCGIWLPQCEYATKQQAAEAWNTRHGEKTVCHCGKPLNENGLCWRCDPISTCWSQAG